MLTSAQRQGYQRDGYLALPGFRDPQALVALRQRAQAIVDDFDPTGPGGVFSSREPSRTADDWLLGSAAGVRCFFEEEAVDAQGVLLVPKDRSINKIGHALHDLDPVFERFSHGADLAELAADLGLAQPQLWQSMLIFKQPGIGGEVRWHQDATYLHSQPMTVTAFWFALEDATLANGCLWVQPGGHHGPLRERFVRGPAGLRHERLDATPWPEPAQALPLEVSAGTLVVFHGLLPHYSAPNRSAVSRQAYTLHAVDAGSTYSADNWLQRGPELPLRGFA
jgi:phytanoyl-CoA hydroxylase